MQDSDDVSCACLPEHQPRTLGCERDNPLTAYPESKHHAFPPRLGLSTLPRRQKLQEVLHTDATDSGWFRRKAKAYGESLVEEANIIHSFRLAFELLGNGTSNW